VKKLLNPLLQSYTARTNGSAIRYLTNSISWNFVAADPEWGVMQAKQLKCDMEDALQEGGEGQEDHGTDLDMDIVLKKGFLEISPRGFNKVRAPACCECAHRLSFARPGYCRCHPPPRARASKQAPAHPRATTRPPCLLAPPRPSDNRVPWWSRSCTRTRS